MLHSVCLRVRVVGVIVRLSLSPFARKRPKLEEVPPGRTGNETLAASTPDLPEHWCQVPVVLSLLSCLSVGRSNVGAVSLSVWLVWIHPCVLCSCGCALCVLLFLFYFFNAQRSNDNDNAQRSNDGDKTARCQSNVMFFFAWKQVSR